MEQNLTQLLNTQQLEATEYIDGPSLIIAGAGSGKTRVLTYKIAHLLQLGVPAYRILALTFTNKAAKEMKERIATIVGGKKASQLWMGTFHSIFSRMLRSHAEQLGYTPQFTIYDTSDSQSLVKNIIKTLQLDDKTYKANAIFSRISSLKNRLISPEEYAKDSEAHKADYFAKIPEFANIYSIYTQRCHAANAMDFDDLLVLTNRLFSTKPEVLASYQDFFEYILIDEYQDTNYAQHRIVKLLAEKHLHVCAVGDDAQSIYSFRGANIDNILNFQRTFPNCQLFKLEQNYRSTQNIVNAANSLIDKNSNQIRKLVFSENQQGNLLEVLNAYTDYDEASVITDKLKQLVRREHYKYADFAILYRTNSQSRTLEESLRRSNIPYKIYGGISFYHRKEIKDMLAYCRLTINKNDEEAFRRAIKTPSKGIGDTTLQKILTATQTHNVGISEVVAHPNDFDLKLNKGMCAKLESFAQLLQSFADTALTHDAAHTAETIMRESGLLAEILSDTSIEGQTQKENIDEFLSAIHEFCEQRVNNGDNNIALSDFLSEVALLTDQDNEKDEDFNKVTLMTIHAAKGLEFNNVFIAGLEEQLFPSAMCVTSSEIEEERRLLYVAITRAKENCILSYAKSRFRNGQTQFSNPSRFIKEIDQQYLHQPQEANTYYGRETATSFRQTKSLFPQTSNASRFKPISDAKPLDASTQKAIESIQVGTNVVHAIFGEGVVKALDGDVANRKATIDFGAQGTRQLLLKYAKLTITE